MSTAAESAAAKSQLSGDIAAGVNTLSLNQVIVFTKYVRMVLPLDGFIFWLRSDLVSQSALFNASNLNAVALNQPPVTVTSAPFLNVQGSLHYATIKEQAEDSTVAVNTVIFTALSLVQDFNQIGPNVIYIATFGELQFAFSQQAPYYQQANTYHYQGQAIYSTMESQIINSLAGFDDSSVVVSNSLPLWLALNGYIPVYPTFRNTSFQLYPSFTVPDNLPPPYGAVHIEPEDTEAIQSVPLLDDDLSHWQLVKDVVKITLYGVRNAQALTFQDCINQYSVDYGYFGLMNMPAFRDEKKTQSELSIIAMKKTIVFEVSYYQNTARQIAQQYIKYVIPTFNFTGLPPSPYPPPPFLISEITGQVLLGQNGEPLMAGSGIPPWNVAY